MAEKALALHMAQELERRGLLEEAAELRRLHAALTNAATIAHCGGLWGMSEAEALVSVRRITLPHWDMVGSPHARAAIAKAEGA